jgi:CubicO group peptidase (beta-lactamase class C family)
MNSIRFPAILKRRLLTTLFLLGVTPALADVSPERLSEFVERGMQLWNVPGMAVAVVSSDEILYRNGFGKTAVHNGFEINEHTLFASASTNKAMVVAGILMLVDEGALSLDDKVTRYVPELHFEQAILTDQVTVRDLLAHRTGLPSTDFWQFFLQMPLPEQVQRLAAVTPQNPFRTGFIYQNTMFELAGLVIERITGLRWDRFLTERLWRPLGMNDTVGARGQIPEGKAYVLPYFDQDGQLTRAAWDIPADLAEAAGSAWTSIHDMSLWAQFLLRGGVTESGVRLLSESGVEEMFLPQQLIPADEFYPASELSEPSWRSYGLGWFQQDFQGRKIDFHTGSLSGLIAIIGLDRAGDRAVIVLGNRDHAEMRHAILWEVMDQSPMDARRDWNRDIFDLYRENQDAASEEWALLESKRLRDTQPSLDLEQYSGHYESAALGEVGVEADEDGMLLTTISANLRMSHWHLDTFLIEYEPWGMREFLTFRIGPDGEIQDFEAFSSTFIPAVGRSPAGR